MSTNTEEKKRIDLLVQKAVEGDEEAFTILIEENKNLLYFVAHKYFRCPDERDDLVQITFIKAWKHLKHYNPKVGNFSGWIAKIAENMAKTILQNKSEQTSYDDVSYNEQDHNPYAITPEKEYNSYFNISKLNKVLTLIEYEIIIYKLYFDLDFHEIADIDGTLNRKEVKAIYEKALIKTKKFKDELEKSVII